MSLGFIILRHVNSEETNLLWIDCYDSIRKIYPLNKILIIDDFSDYTFVDTTKILSNALIIQSEFKGRGELLPYYYYFHNKLFDRAVILQDSVFIQKYINFEGNNFLWSFEHHWDHLYDYTKIVNNLDNISYINYMMNNNNLWNGCFGVMSCLSHDFLCELQNTFNLFNLINHITTRTDRMCLERIFAILFTLCNNTNNTNTNALFGDIHRYCIVGQTYSTYKTNNNDIDKPIVKVWVGR
jgi:hypothetical protein